MPLVVTIGEHTHTIRPVHWRYLRAKLDCLDAGQSLTQVNLAKYLKVSRMAVWKLQQRYPWLDPWCAEVMRAANTHRWGSIQRRMASLGEQGHVAAADQFCKMESGYYQRGRSSPFGGEDDDSDLLDNTRCTINILVPHRQLPDGGRLPEPAALTSTLPPLADIPVIAVR